MNASNFHIRSEAFPVLQEDFDECCNPGTYGKSLVNYLQARLEALGYIIPFTVAEDFGWWIEIKTGLGVPSNIILCRSHEGAGIADFAVMTDTKVKKWSWKRFRIVDLGDFQNQLAADVQNILMSDNRIQFVADNLDGYEPTTNNEEA